MLFSGSSTGFLARLRGRLVQRIGRLDPACVLFLPHEY